MAKIEIHSETFGKYIVNGYTHFVYPGTKETIEARDGDVVTIVIQENDIFRNERIAYLENESKTLFNNDD